MVSTELNPAFDTPQFGEVSSFGAFGEPKPATYGRFKGFYTGGVIGSVNQLQVVLSQFHATKHKLNGEFTRVQHRVIVDAQILRQQRNKLAPHIEAVVLLDPGHLGNEPALVYLSYNTKTRQPDPNDLIIVNNHLRMAQSIQPKNLYQLLAKTKSNGFTVEILTPSAKQKAETIEQLFELYKRFNWGRGDVIKILSGANNLIAVVKDKGMIVSAGMAEMVLVPVENTFLRAAEITEAATLEAYFNRGLYTGISTTLLLELRRLSYAREIFSGELDIAFGESNLLSPAVLTIAAYQGRVFSTRTCCELGFPNSGILRQQVPILGPINSRTGLNDLVVTSITRSALYTLS